MSFSLGACCNGGIELSELSFELLAHDRAPLIDEHAADVSASELEGCKFRVDGCLPAHARFGLVVVLLGLRAFSACAEVLNGIGDEASDELGSVLDALLLIVCEHALHDARSALSR